MEKLSEKKSNHIYCSMENLSKSELLQIILKQNENVTALTKQVKQLIDVNKKLIERNKSVSAPSRSVKQKVEEDNIIAPPPVFRDKSILAPRRSVKQMVEEYEDNIIAPLPEFRDEPISAEKQPVPPPRTKIKQVNKALQGFTESYEVNIINEEDPLIQLQKTRQKLGFYIKNILESMKGLKFIETLKVSRLKKQQEEKK